MKHLIPYFKQYRLESILAPVFKMLEASFDLVVPLVVAKIIDKGIPSGDVTAVIPYFLQLIIMAVLGLGCSFTAQYFAAKAAIGTAAGLRHQLLEHIQSLNFAELDRVGASTLITRMTSDVNQVQNGLNMFLRLFLRSPFIVFGAMLMAFTINVKLALIFVAMIAVLFTVVFGIMSITSPLYRRVQRNLDSIMGAARENLSGVRVIRAFGREKSQIQYFKDVNQQLLSAQLKAGKIAAMMNPLTYAIVNTGIIVILWVGSLKVDSGILLTGDIVALVNYISQILVELVKLANLAELLGKAIVSMGRVGQILDIKSSMNFYGHETGMSDTDEVVRFNHVSLRYEGFGDESLSDISFTAKRGQTIGIIGGTGSGKSSLLHLIPRFYDATSGCIYLKGKHIMEWDKSALQKSVAIVPQKAQLFTGTIRSNLLLGKSDVTDEELWNALEIAQAAEFVHQKTGGLDEPIEQGGRNLSGGQRQRLTIARALVAKADILILDDSSSALDYATDAALRKALRSLPNYMTVFIVSQRTSSIQHTDLILVLDDGRLVGSGNHAQLLQDCTVYQEIYDSQFKKEG